MAEQLIKNVEHAVPLSIKDIVAYEDGKVASLTLSQMPGVGLTLMAFDRDESIASHAAPGDAMVQVLEGEADITVGGKLNRVKAGEIIVMPKGVAHSLKAVTRFKMLLTLVK